MDLKWLLMNLEKPENQSMDEFLRGVKNTADSLTAIQFAVSDMDLTQCTLNTSDSDYMVLSIHLIICLVSSCLMMLGTSY